MAGWRRDWVSVWAGVRHPRRRREGGGAPEMLGSGLNLVTTVIGFGMSATFIVFVCARLICGRAARADADTAAVAAARALAQPPAPFDFDVEFRNVADLDRTVSAHLPTLLLLARIASCL